MKTKEKIIGGNALIKLDRVRRNIGLGSKAGIVNMKDKKMKQLTLNDFTPLVSWEEIERKMGKREYKKFLNWMKGQTVVEGGVYIWDLERFLNNQPVID